MKAAMFNCLPIKQQLEVQAMANYIKDGEKAQKARH